MEPFWQRLRPHLVAGARILDIGSGRRPTVPKDLRPAGGTYDGLDLSINELENAPPGSYDRMFASDICDRLPELQNKYDLAVSWQVLEHVRPLSRALENTRGYLRPGGTFIAQLSGTFAPFALLNQLIPHSLARPLLRVVMRRDSEGVFPAHYDRCWYSALRRSMAEWQECEILPLYRGAEYFKFARPLMAVCLAYEEWARAHPNLAGTYIIRAVK
jgi:SAM-dependent methyltransferase